MNELRAYLVKYVRDLNDILARTVDDKSILELLSEREGDIIDLQLLMIKAGFPSQRFEVRGVKTTEISVNFVNDGRTLTVCLDNSMTAKEIIAELIAAKFIVANPLGYQLSSKGSMLDHSRSLIEMGLQNGNTIHVIPVTDGGGYSDQSFVDSDEGHGGVDKEDERNILVKKQ